MRIAERRMCRHGRYLDDSIFPPPSNAQHGFSERFHHTMNVNIHFAQQIACHTGSWDVSTRSATRDVSKRRSGPTNRDVDKRMDNETEDAGKTGDAERRSGLSRKGASVVKNASAVLIY
jgi:hypothetical protein